MTPNLHIRRQEPAHISQLSREARIPPLLAHILLNRGFSDPRKARDFLEARQIGLHDPALLPGAVEAAERVAAAVRADRRILIYGDYDVDGVCGTSILWSCLRLAGAKHVDYYIPHRVEEGYGVNAEALKTLAAESRADLVITVDCGITAVEEARLARALGIELIVTDHHALGPELPEADVLVHPCLPGSTYPWPELCGAGVAFKLAWQVAKGFNDGKKASPHLRQFLIKAMNLVALATVADVVPLEDENRVFVRHGLAGIRDDPSVGLHALLEAAGCLNSKRRLSTGTIGFQLAPRINAAGRLERAMAAVELLTTDDAVRAREIAADLNDCNARRQDVEKAIVAEAHALIDEQGGLGERGALVLAKEGWHPGVIGIVAGRIAEIYHRPTIVIALGDGEGQGSARSVPGFNLVEALHACSEGLTRCGGHKAAAGLKLPAHICADFATRFDTHCRAHLSPEMRVKTIHVDAEVLLGELSLSVLEAIDDLEPFGMGNPRPLLLSEDVEVVGTPRVVGEKQNHLQLRFGQGNVVVKAIAWSMASRREALQPGSRWSIVYHPSINEWNNRREVQLEIREIIPVAAPVATPEPVA